MAVPPTQALSLIGYFPKQVEQRPDWLKADRVVAIRSVSDCISKGPANWINQWKHNTMYLYFSEATAESIIPEGQRSQFEIHAYRLLPAIFDTGMRMPLELPMSDIDPLPANFASVGFDAVSKLYEFHDSQFACSPLSCNSMAEEIETNEHCLLTDLTKAEEVALRFSIEEPEPGPYYVVEVLRRVETQ
ncbi:MAG TPA: hypothetical protein VF595_10310 [Tepidisphaeraceae bacterium]|jgi:hypothetical protein